MLNPNIDRKALAAQYAADDRVRIPALLEEAVAERIRDICLRDVPWEYLTHVDGKNIVIPASDFERMNQGDANELYRKVSSAASDGVGFFYCGYKIDRRHADTDSEDLRFLHDVFDFLSGDEMLGLIRDVTGRNDIRSADAQYTRYAPGQFLTRHRDAHDAEQRRLAYVLSFSKHWHPDWGGLLQFFEEDGTPRDAWIPTFNAMSLFDIRHIHSVTYVTPFALQPRLSLTGWFRAKAAGA